MTTKRGSRRRQERASRGFTLIELVAVVCIIGILATIAIYSVRKYIQHAKASEAAEMIGAIKAGQEAYYDETFQYLAVSPSTNDYYPDHPDVASGQIKIQWGAANSATGCTACGTRYKALGVLPAAPVLFRYMCVTGANGTNPSTGLPQGGKVVGAPFGSANATQAYYVVSAVSNLDGNASSEPMTAVVGDPNHLWMALI